MLVHSFLYGVSGDYCHSMFSGGLVYTTYRYSLSIVYDHRALNVC